MSAASLGGVSDPARPVPDLKSGPGQPRPAPGAGRPTACFFARVRDRSVLTTTEFYAQDLVILRDLGFDVRVATRWSELVPGADLYFIWWWTWATLPLLRARLAGRPALVTGAFNDVPFQRRSGLQRAVIRANYRMASANVAVSRHDAIFLRGSFLGRSGRLDYVPHSVDTSVYSPGDGTRREEFCLSVCWMRRPNAVRKCMFELIRAVPLVLRERPGMKFLLAGSPEDGGPELRGLAESLGVGHAVEFLGRVDTAEKVRLMRTCQMYLQPTRYEGFGLAIAEAMACGAPVVSSPVGAVPEVVGGHGEMVDGNDPASIARGVLRLAGRPDLRLRRSADGRRHIESNYTTAHRREGLLRVIRGLGVSPGIPANPGPESDRTPDHVHP